MIVVDEGGKEIVLKSPIGQSEICENGSFENGNFNTWTGKINSESFDRGFNTSGIFNTIHEIKTVPFIDPYVDFIGVLDGTYMAQLGLNYTDGINFLGGTAYLTHCFDVNESNKLFKFNWAL